MDYFLPLRTTATLATGTTQSHDVAGLDCGTAYRFGIKGYGDGRNYRAVWGAYSKEGATTDACPTFTPTPTYTPTPTHTPTATPMPVTPSIDITSVIPGTTGMFVKLAWDPDPPSSLSSLTLEWDQTSGTVCSVPFVSCTGSDELDTSNPADVTHVVEDSFVVDSDYASFSVTAIMTIDGQQHTVGGTSREP